MRNIGGLYEGRVGVSSQSALKESRDAINR